MKSSLILFVSLIIFVYSLLHLYACHKIIIVWPGGIAGRLALIGFMVLMIAAPVLTHYFAGRDQIVAARAIGWVGYLWMGWVFLFFVIGLCADIVRGLGQLRPVGVVLVMIITTIVVIYGVFEAKHVRVKNVVINPCASLPCQRLS